MLRSRPRSLLYLFCCGLAAGAAAQSIQTVVGGGPIGDGKVATEALLNLPTDVAIDAAGNVFIADTTNHRVRRVDGKTGIITTFAGGGTSGLGDGGPATAAEVRVPVGLAVDAAGNVYVSHGPRIRRIDRASGIITTYAGGGLSTDDGIPATSAAIGSQGMAFDRNGDLYVSDGNHHRLRRISPNGIISTIAGNGTAGFSGDGGPATAAQLNYPRDVALDGNGNLFVGDVSNNRVRRIDAQTALITTVAGNGLAERGGPDGVPATQSAIFIPTGVAVDSAGNLFIAEQPASRVRRVDAKTGIISTYAGASTGAPGYAGDGGPATVAKLDAPQDVALDGSGNLYIADTRNQRIRRVDAATTKISSVAGGGPFGDGGPATSAQLFAPHGVAVDSQGNLYTAEEFGYRVRKVPAATGTISTIYNIDRNSFDGPTAVAVDTADNVYVAVEFNQIVRIDAKSGAAVRVAGGGCCQYAGDGGPATQAALNHPKGVHVDAAGNLYIGDSWNNRVRRVDAKSGIINTVAGIGPSHTPGDLGSYSGDGGPATAAALNDPQGVVTDRDGNLFIADRANCRVRRVDAATGIITTVAGVGCNTGGCGSMPCPAIQAQVGLPLDVDIDESGNLSIAEQSGLVQKVDLRSGIMTSFIGRVGGGFAGDGGPATAATLDYASGVVSDKRGNFFIADKNNNRIRAVYACVPFLAPATLTAPADAATSVSTSPTLQWNAVPAAFRYDVYLDSIPPPRRFIAQDLTATSFVPANLQPGVTYYWQVISKPDPFCLTAPGLSPIFSFTTSGGCTAPGAFDTTAPNNGAAGVPFSVDLTWQPASGASSYDVYFGVSSPPALFASNINTTKYSIAGLTAETTYHWYVVAHASCDSTKTTSTAVRSFRTAGTCAAAGPFNLTSPADGATNLPTTVTLEWSASVNASSYELYFGTTSPPPIYLFDLAKPKLTISGLQPQTTYNWRVVAKVACDPAKSLSTATAKFTTGGTCTAPGPASIIFAPPGRVGVGQTYTIAWKEAAGLDAGGSYVVERSTTPAFTTIVDTQETFSTSASFISSNAGTYYHRVRAVPGCDAQKGGPYSDVRGVTVVTGTSNVIFSLQPQAVITTLGEKLEDRKALFTLENLGATPLQVILGKGEIDSVPFFSISDPFGGGSVFVTLESKKPKTFEIHFSGPPNDRTAAYQGIVFVAATGQGLAITPYAFVDLKVGGTATSRPIFLTNGRASEYAFFPGLSGDDRSRPPITVDIRNEGGSPMELAADIGPEVWLVPESGWNSSPIPAGATRTVRLTTQRSRAPNGSALPRYTYFTVRSKNGETARLLVQDNDALPTATGRSSVLDPGSRSYIVPGVASSSNSFTRLRLTNVGSEGVQMDLFFTPAGADGFDTLTVKRATVLIPPNDVVTLTDPLAQVFGLTAPAVGEIEVRAAPERIGFLLVSASVVTPIATGGAYTYQLPVLQLGEGARIGSNHVMAGIASSASVRASMTLVETSGTEATRVHATLFDAQGTKRGESSDSVARYGQKTIDLATISGGVAIEGGRIDLAVESGGGAVTAVVTMLDGARNSGATIVSQPVATSASATALARLQERALESSTLATAVAPVVINGASSRPNTSYRTSMGFTSSGGATTAVVTYRPSDPTATPIEKTIQLLPSVVLHFDNVLEQLFGLAPGTSAQGSVFIRAASGGQIYARLLSSATGGGAASITGSLPIFATFSEVMTSVASRRPLYLDGLEQSVEPSRGSRWAVLVNETAGSGGNVAVRLYEAGNRSLPIAEKTLAIRPYEQVRLDSVFSTLGLDTDERRKDRTNVLCVVTADGGGGVVSAVGVATDNATGDIKHYVFSPSGGVPATGVVRLSIVTPVTPPPNAGRRRTVRP